MLYSLGDKRVVTQGDYYVADNATVVGSVVIGHNASVWFNCVLRGDNDTITLGENVNVQDGSVLHVDPGHPLTLERNVSVGHMAMLHGCTVREGSLVGINAVVLNDAVIGRNCIVGANALVAERKEFPDGSLILGSPARVARPLSEEQVAGLVRTWQHYVEKSALYRNEMKPQD